jgi:hypothetical protein
MSASPTGPRGQFWRVLLGGKLFHFVQAAEQHPEFAAELPAFPAESSDCLRLRKSVNISITWRERSTSRRKSRS